MVLRRSSRRPVGEESCRCLARFRARRALSAGAVAMVSATALSGCGLGQLGLAGAGGAPESRATFTVRPAQGEKAAAPGEPIVVRVADGRFTSVVVKNPNGRTVKGTLSRGRTHLDLPAPQPGYGAAYTVEATAVDREGVPTTTTERFSTLVPARTSGARVNPSEGGVVGVGHAGDRALRGRRREPGGGREAARGRHQRVDADRGRLGMDRGPRGHLPAAGLLAGQHRDHRERPPHRGRDRPRRLGRQGPQHDLPHG